MNFLNGLNKKQRQAVEADGNILIIAGPGTGKTRTLTHRIAYLLLEKKVKPKDVVAVTFTKKAAAEMKERVENLISNSEFLITKQTTNSKAPIVKQAQLPFIGTFHSLAYEMLVMPGYEPGIATEKQVAEIIRKICGKCSPKKNLVIKRLSDQEIKRLISLFKTGVNFEFPANFDQVVEEYDTSFKEQGLMDYDDLLINALDLLKKKKIGYKYILVDEFQDTINLQYLLVKALLKKDGKLFVIGDPKQSIYSFRGSNEKIFDEFRKDFPEAEEIFLDTNYRSRENIVKTSSALFDRADSLKTIKAEKGNVKLVETFNQYSEADWILKEINQKVGGIDLNFAADVDIDKQTFSFSDFAVVYRTHSLNNVLERKFYELGIPFQIIGSKSLYQQKEIRFIILCLIYLASFVFMYRYMNTKDRGVIVGEIKEVKVVDHPVSLVIDKLEKFVKKDRLSDLVKQIVDEFSLEKVLEGKKIQSQNLREFVGSTIRFDKQKEGLIKFLEYIRHLEQHEYYDERADRVTLMTMHAAKGLEFPFVYIIGFEDGTIPYKRSVDEGGVDEERRLMYVAMTRAESELQMIYTQKRFGKRVVLSRFARQFFVSPMELVVDEQILKIKRRMERSKKNQLDLF